MKNVAETAALALAGLYFVYRTLSGYLIVNMSISIDCKRQRMPGGTGDWLVIEVRLKKGELGTVSLHDAQVQVRAADKVMRAPLTGFDRRSYRTESIGDESRRVIDWDNRSRTSPFINLSPNEEASFGCMTEVAIDQSCVVEAAVLGKRKFSWCTGQWRVSRVVPPLDVAAKDTN